MHRTWQLSCCHFTRRAFRNSCFISDAAEGRPAYRPRSTSARRWGSTQPLRCTPSQGAHCEFCRYPHAFLHPGLPVVCDSVRSLFLRLSSGGRRQDDGPLHHPGCRLRSRLQFCCQRHGAGQRTCQSGLRAVRRHLPGVWRRMCQTPSNALPGVRLCMPPMRRRVRPHGVDPLNSWSQGHSSAGRLATCACSRALDI